MESINIKRAGNVLRRGALETVNSTVVGDGRRVVRRVLAVNILRTVRSKYLIQSPKNLIW